MLALVKKRNNNHLRDNNIPQFLEFSTAQDLLFKRPDLESLKSLWDDTIVYIANNEKRIKVETVSFNNVEIFVWRFARDSVPLKFSNKSTNFLVLENLINKNVADKSIMFKKTRNDILEYCKEINSIVHISSDPFQVKNKL